MEDKRGDRIKAIEEEVRRLQQYALDLFDIPLKGIDSSIIKHQIIAEIRAKIGVRNNE